MMIGIHDVFSLQNLADSAIRSLLLAMLVSAAFWALRVRNAAAQKSAWVLVLAGSIVMPVLTPISKQLDWLGKTIRVDANQLVWLKPSAPKLAVAPAPEPAPSSTTAVNPTIASPQQWSSGLSTVPVEVSSPVQPARRIHYWPDISLMLYWAIAALLLARLIYGLFASLRLWFQAERTEIDGHETLRVRRSPRLTSPVTIGSGILLPITCARWDERKLRMVLAHEAEHVRQGDFYLNLCAELYVAFFWFSPLGWWLKNRICDLSEIISDGAAVDEAACHASYAQVLLEFAALPRTTTIGVAMARPGIAQRIERLLNETSFRQAFAGSPWRKMIAGAVVPAVLLAATTLFHVSVKAAAQVPEPSAIPQPQALPAPAEPAAPAPMVEPVPIPKAVPQPPEPPSVPETPAKNEHGYSYYFDNDGESYALVRDGHLSGSGRFDSLENGSIDKARSAANGEFLWFTRNGKGYFVDDPAIIAQIDQMYKPMELLGEQQAELGKQQEELGRKAQELARQAEAQIRVQKPDLTKELAKLDATAIALKASKEATISPDQLAELQARLAEMQAKIGNLQGDFGAKMGAFGAQQGKLGALQGQLGEKQGRIGAEQGRLAREADKKVRSIIEQSLKDGKAHPVE